MPLEVLVKNATGLPDKYVDMAANYIRYLQYQYSQEEKQQGKRKLGILADKFHYIADDFDETPEDFKEYL